MLSFDENETQEEQQKKDEDILAFILLFLFVISPIGIVVMLTR